VPRDVESLPPDDRVRHQVGRRLGNVVLGLASLALLVAWSWFGLYELEPGEHAVILRLGEYDRTVTTPGLKWHLPPPLESHRTVAAATIRREAFGFPREAEASSVQREQGTVQTRDNNVVHIGFVVQYRIRDAFRALYRVASPEEALRDAAQAAIRQIVGRTGVDGVLSERRGQVQSETGELLQSILDGYEAGIFVEGVELQEVQPPPQVQDAFDDVNAADQDRDRLVNQAQAHANEVLPRARAQAAELREEARAYRDERVAGAEGAAERFGALLAEYRQAPEVTRARLYLETMEEVLPEVEKILVDPEAGPVLPHLPLGSLAPRPSEGPAPGRSRGEAR